MLRVEMTLVGHLAKKGVGGNPIRSLQTAMQLRSGATGNMGVTRSAVWQDGQQTARQNPTRLRFCSLPTTRTTFTSFSCLANRYTNRLIAQHTATLYGVAFTGKNTRTNDTIFGPIYGSLVLDYGGNFSQTFFLSLFFDYLARHVDSSGGFSTGSLF